MLNIKRCDIAQTVDQNEKPSNSLYKLDGLFTNRILTFLCTIYALIIIAIRPNTALAITSEYKPLPLASATTINRTLPTRCIKSAVFNGTNFSYAVKIPLNEIQGKLIKLYSPTIQNNTLNFSISCGVKFG